MQQAGQASFSFRPFLLPLSSCFYFPLCFHQPACLVAPVSTLSGRVGIPYPLSIGHSGAYFGRHGGDSELFHPSTNQSQRPAAKPHRRRASA